MKEEFPPRETNSLLLFTPPQTHPVAAYGCFDLEASRQTVPLGLSLSGIETARGIADVLMDMLNVSFMCRLGRFRTIQPKRNLQSLLLQPRNHRQPVSVTILLETAVTEGFPTEKSVANDLFCSHH
ncbi:TOM1-like protein 2 [Artemisia annua]|uniref:TOM1-like protein 2 n=1 Tax=Artemisia annua TaxID=35608 RepID=A0A2U1MMM2_ARTAN|nr:TOM1-like protein 2 [Artemisia annua]